MKLFRKNKTSFPAYPLEEYEPIIRCSICTGEQVACMKNKTTGQMHEIMLVRSPSDLEEFCTVYGVSPESIRKIY